MNKTAQLLCLNMVIALTGVILCIRGIYWLHSHYQPVAWLDPAIPGTAIAFAAAVIIEIKLFANPKLIINLLNVTMLVSFLVLAARTGYWINDHNNVPTFFDVIAPVSCAALIAAFITKSNLQRSARIRSTGNAALQPTDVAARVVGVAVAIYIALAVVVFMLLVIGFAIFSH